MIKLEISPFEGRSAQVFSISQARTAIGRNPTNDIVVNRSFISGAHAEILRSEDGELKIKDLGSSNGTFVNDEKISCSPIKPGDKLQFGDLKGRLTESNEEEHNFFDSLAISQAKQAMKKLDQGVPSGSGQAIELEEGFLAETAAGESPSKDASAPAGKPEDHLIEPKAETSAAVPTEIETLKMRISELENRESELVRANEAQTETLAENVEVISELSGQLKEKEAAFVDQQNETTAFAESSKQLTRKEAEIAALSEQVKEKEAALDDQLKETAALRTEVDALQSAHGEVAEAYAQLGSVQQEIESFEPERARQQQELNDFLAQAEATKAAAIEESAEVTSALESSRKQLEALTQAINEAQQEDCALIEKVTKKTREIGKQRRAEADLMMRIEERKAQLSVVQQEIESVEPQRTQHQQELNDFLAQAELTKAAATEENAEVTSALETSQKQLESLKEAIREVQQEKKDRIEEVKESTQELEERRRVEAESLTQIEDRKAAAELQLSEITLSTKAMEEKCGSVEARIVKEEKALKRIHRKIGWRKKLLKRLKTVARREREVAKKMEEAERVLEGAAPHHQAPGITLTQVQPWDVDRARADRDEAIEEARKIREEVHQMKATLRKRQGELLRIETRDRQKEQPEPAHS